MGWYLTDPARDDLDGIWFHIAGDNVAAADKVVARLVERFDMLARQPLIGEACPELKSELRNFPVRKPSSFWSIPRCSMVSSNVRPGGTA